MHWAVPGSGSARRWHHQVRAAPAYQLESSGLRIGSIDLEPCKHMVHQPQFTSGRHAVLVYRFGR